MVITFYFYDLLFTHAYRSSSDCLPKTVCLSQRDSATFIGRQSQRVLGVASAESLRSF